MKPQVGNDRNGYFIILHPNSKKDYYLLGCLSRQITHKMLWANEPTGDGDFKPIEMKVYMTHLMDYLAHSKRIE